MIAHELARLVTVGFHNPKKMPDFKPSNRRKAQTEKHPSQLEAEAVLFRQTMMAFAKKKGD